MKRKLTTILFADAQGYSTLMASDEAATLERLNRYRAIMRGLFERHEGRQINTWGDAVIAEFASVVEAVRCAVEIQDSLSTENLGLAKDKQMWFRLGINLGDVMIDGDDLYGDGVNVAQRLQALAEPGGIMVSGTVYSLAHKQLALAFDFAGEQKVTDGSERVPSYRVRMPGRNVPEVVVHPGDLEMPSDPPPHPAAESDGARRRSAGWRRWPKACSAGSSISRSACAARPWQSPSSSSSTSSPTGSPIRGSSIRRSRWASMSIGTTGVGRGRPMPGVG